MKWHEQLDQHKDTRCREKQALLMSSYSIDLLVEYTCEDCQAVMWKHRNSHAKYCCGCTLERRRERIRNWSGAPSKPKEGFPRQDALKTEAEIRAYLSGDKIACLLCGHEFRGLFKHVERRHGISVEEYKRMFGLPLGDGLVGAETSQMISENSTKVMATRDRDAVLQQLHDMRQMERSRGSNDYMPPATLKKRREIIKKAIASPSHISNLASNLMELPCGRCGATVAASEMYVITHRCKIVCPSCATKQQRESWARHREKWSAVLAQDPGHRLHGTYGGYACGCRCARCVEAARAYNREWAKQHRGSVRLLHPSPDVAVDKLAE